MGICMVTHSDDNHNASDSIGVRKHDWHITFIEINEYTFIIIKCCMNLLKYIFETRI